MKLHLLIPSFVLSLLVFPIKSTSFGLPELASYAKVSRTGNSGNITSRKVNSHEGRGFRDNNAYRSPVYLHKGEVLDNPTTSVKGHQHYSTLDKEAVAKLDLSSGTKAQKRFHPPAKFEHIIAHSNAANEESPAITSSGSGKPNFPVPSYATLPRDAYSTNYRPPDTKPFDDDNDSPPPAETDDFTEIRDSYQNGGDAPKFSFPSITSSSSSSSSSYGEKYPPKPPDYDEPSFVDDSYLHHHHHDYPHDLIYDHPPPPKTTTTTEEPEMNDQRLSKRPYSYYYIGKKLWYLPLYFSIYFIIYIAALVLKSITRHKINFPASLAAVSADARRGEGNWEAPSWLGLTRKVLDGIDAYNSIGKTPKSES